MGLKRSWLFLFLLLLVGIAQAEQGCPDGLYPGGAAPGQICIPMPGYGVGGNIPAAAASKAARKLTWGAVALSSTGEIGAITGQPSESKAKREALARCAGYGGKDCKLNLAYKNQCVVVVWPSVVGASAFSQSAASVEEASDMALPACAAKSGAQCKIAYSACTEPVLVGN
ncbi:DUF4189 domain-containing protein [Lysobacter capsici]|uniref:DUF4189 domain-containing protein n=1 Tax=Lysobacter capsici TaxID=435897 RepID=UPI00287B7669|nr:DUF4189 domain-containing protein [Lysobacter capsici]WND82822.1 DUF4189 domain-containing protein [Lysobacter capsici]WND88020.1 DUF4189 domain-containing protein [Lysobacter capsici]